MNFNNLKEKYNIEKILEEKESLEKKLIDKNKMGDNKDIGELASELSKKNNEYDLVNKIYKKVDEYNEALEILENENEKEFLEIAKKETKDIEKDISDLEKELKESKYSEILKDPDDNKATILEIRAGAGGDEASLFANDLFRMYTLYSNPLNWKIEIISSMNNSSGGTKEIVAHISGKNVFKKLKYESGVHRVQRIPTTESSGRIHTSTVSVAVLPEAKNIDITINPEDIRVDVMRASGAGGQSVNKTDSAVRITHLATNIVVSCQETKYQQQNKDKAMAILRSKLYDREKTLAQEKRSSLRLSQIGSAMRSEKIRTYNYPQNRVTDHRIKKSWHNLEEILNGKLEDMITDINQSIIEEQIEIMEKNG